MKAYNIRLRPHHLLCIYGFRGLGYSKEFINNTQGIIDRIGENPSIEIEVVRGVDDICLKCPHNVGSKCIRPGRNVDEFDEGILGRLKMVAGRRLEARSLLGLMEGTISPEELSSICKGCEWLRLGYCEQGLRRKNWWKRS